MSTSVEFAQTFLDRWAGDPAGAMRDMVAPDVVYTLNVARTALPIGGETTGWDAVNDMMLGVRHVFDYLVYRPRLLSAKGDVARFRVEMILRHRSSGELLTGFMRSVVTIRDQRVSRVDEFVDAPLIETFMRLFASGPSVATAQPDAAGGQ